MAKSTQSTLRSSRLQMVPREGMAQLGGDRWAWRREGSPGSMPSPPRASECT